MKQRNMMLARFAVALGALGLSAGALAQQAGSTPGSSAADEDQLSEVVVTAERTTQNLQKVPIAANVQTGADLETHNITNVTGLQFDTPGLSVTTGAANITFVNIRGVGYSAATPQVSVGVANYRDGLFITQSPFLVDTFYDVQQVEVLRGPQGTLSGQNSTGGEVQVTSRNPTLDHDSGYVDAQFGNYQDVQVDGAANLPMNDRYGARLAFNYESRNSFYDNQGPGDGVVVSSHPGNLLRENVRLSLLGEPVDAVQILLKLEHNIVNSDGQPMKPIPGTIFAPFAPANPFTINYNVLAGENDVRADRANLQVSWHVLDGVDFKSQTGYQTNELLVADDEDATNQNGQYSTQDVSERTFTQEFSLLSTGAGPLQWVVGTFYLYDRLPSKFTIEDFVGPLSGPPFDPLTEGINVVNNEASAAVYGQSTWTITPQWQLVTGLRYTEDRKWNSGNLSLGPIILTSPGDYKQYIPSGKAALNWNVTDRDLLYITASRGFKTGGINTGAPGFSPEYVWNYEAGYKTTVFDGHVRTQVDAYYMNYTNFQVSQIGPLGGAGNIVNTAGAVVKGVEGQLQMKLAGLQVDATGAYNHSAFKGTSIFNTDSLPFDGFIPSFLLPLPPSFFAANQVNIGGHPLDFAPKFTGNLGIEYRLHPGFVPGALTPRAQLSYVGGQWGEPYDTPVFDYIPSHSTLDLRLTYEPDDKWRVALYGTNITNEVYLVGKDFRYATQFYGAPLQFGIRASRSFD